MTQTKEEIRDRRKRYRTTHAKEIASYRKTYNSDIGNRARRAAHVENWQRKHPEKHAFKTYYYSAKARGIAWELSFEEFISFWKNPCIYGCEIQKIGLDRINTDLGYSIGNIQPMCTDHNLMKSDLSTSVFEKLCRMVANKKEA